MRNTRQCEVEKTSTLRDHVCECPVCYVMADGSVWYCDVADAIIQEKRKQKFFGKKEV
jgi:hypothetical protein